MTETRPLSVSARRVETSRLEVTNDRLLALYERWFTKLDGAERDAISMVRTAVWRLIEEELS